MGIVVAVHHPWVFAFGLLGNIISFMVYLAPLPTFYGIYKKKKTEGFDSLAYVVALLSAMLWMYYAFLTSNDANYLLITINSIGCVIESIYITIFLAYAPKTAKIQTAKLILLLNLGMYSLILLLTLLLVKEPISRVRIVGWVCVAVSVTVFAAPFSVMRMVIRTKSVKFMPFPLSVFLTLSAVIWFSYGLLLKDLYIVLPNTLGFILGVIQMVMYRIYKNNDKVKGHLEEKTPEEEEHTINVLNLKQSTMEISDLQKICNGNDLEEEQKQRVNETADDHHHLQKTMGTSTPTGVDDEDVQIIVCQV
ncbi:bidirectional sugar transporter SWEET14-like [Telopea speciosissima]|uniref:bidirectional sugar transporter SWEET14-like n=1 Tax=Telopea speciosissima TaxID=54955 RepID=UPI001CC41978|nr:bidirectional sugar transporter SWEET14-like [Telopea speciosissima]